MFNLKFDDFWPGKTCVQCNNGDLSSLDSRNAPQFEYPLLLLLNMAMTFEFKRKLFFFELAASIWSIKRWSIFKQEELELTRKINNNKIASFVSAEVRRPFVFRLCTFLIFIFHFVQHRQLLPLRFGRISILVYNNKSKYEGEWERERGEEEEKTTNPFKFSFNLMMKKKIEINLRVCRPSLTLKRI